MEDEKVSVELDPMEVATDPDDDGSATDEVVIKKGVSAVVVGVVKTVDEEKAIEFIITEVDVMVVEDIVSEADEATLGEEDTKATVVDGVVDRDPL